MNIPAMTFWKILYNMIIVPVMWIGFHIGGVFNEKIRRGIAGRKNLLATLERRAAQLPSHTRLWFHASSLGEFEQAKPIIAELKKLYPGISIIATFFSPSGYEHSKNYKLADIISYLPFDTHRATKKFISILKPAAAIMVRYDTWPNVIWALKKNAIPTFIANATMKKNSSRKFPVLRQFHHVLYNCFTHILTVSENDKTSFADFGIAAPLVSAIGDTRFDQVMMRSIEAQKKNLLPVSVTTGKKILVVGQSWEADEEIILPVLFKLQEHMPELLTILVPHEPTIEHLEELEYQLSGNSSFIRFSDLNEFRNERIILIDSVGVLVPLYRYAHIAYVGGSFRQGIHNVLEPAVFSLPIIFGPKHDNSQEAISLVKREAAFVIEDDKQLYRVLRMLLENESARACAGNNAKTFVDENVGATLRFLAYLTPFLSSAQGKQPTDAA
jgi:3-deoxy-D-manno-octulosonic-acid transferase